MKVLDASEMPPEWKTGEFCFQVPDCRLDTSFGHSIPAN